MGWSRELRQFTHLTVQAGPRWTSYRGIQPEVAVSFARDGRTVKAGVDYSHGETIILGVSGPVEVDTGAARLTSRADAAHGIRRPSRRLGPPDARRASGHDLSRHAARVVDHCRPIHGDRVYSADYQLGDIAAICSETSACFVTSSASA